MKRLTENRALVVALIAILLGLIAGGILIAVTGSNPAASYLYLFSGGLMSIERIGNTLATATPLVLTGLAVAFAFRTGLFNIGGAGQMLVGGLCATAVALFLHLPKALMLPLEVLAAMAGGALWAAVPGVLKARFNVHEVVSTIMMNWVAYWLIYYTVPAYMKGELETESRLIGQSASLKVDWMTNLFHGSFINLGFFIVIAAVALVAFLINRTTLGYELKAVGFNRHAAEYAGIGVRRNILLSMMISGLLAGLAGACQYVGYASSIQIGSLPGQGYDGIAVALLGANNPWGVFAAAIFFGLLHSGKGFMSAMTQVPPDIADTIIATIIYFAATSVLIERGWDFLRRRRIKEAKADVVDPD